MRPGSSIHDTMLVAQYFRNFGLSVSASPDNHILFAHGTYGQAGAAAHTGFVRVQLNGEQFTRTTMPESYPPAVASRILATTIFDGPRMHPMNVMRPLGILVAPGGGYSPANIATYYDGTSIATAGFKGTGRKVAIVVCGTALTADIKKFESLFGIPSNLPTIVSVDGGSTTQDGEPTLDVETEISTANAVSIFLYVTPDTCSLSTFADGIAKVEADNTTKHFDSVNISYGLSEDSYDAAGADALITSQHADLVDLEAANCWPFVASGDSGAFENPNNFREDGELTVSYPASDDHVIAVGGTTASSKSPSLIARNREVAWGGSGGGVSGKFGLPTWQVGVAGLESTTHRNVPDVAFDADLNTGREIVFTPPGSAQGAFVFGGTSMAAPAWAAFLALVQQKRVTIAKATLKPVAADLYAASKVAGNFVDITMGSNNFYPAKVGYDAVTGVGVPDEFKLWTYLYSLP
ncbi:MAG: S8 family serine peptidase [Candidatus Eremiobacteraeota bacterium]|nr:S8 family serine peptidase [Candidatus Eremiobacteraeota bacterium]